MPNTGISVRWMYVQGGVDVPDGTSGLTHAGVFAEACLQTARLRVCFVGSVRVRGRRGRFWSVDHPTKPFHWSTRAVRGRRIDGVLFFVQVFHSLTVQTAALEDRRGEGVAVWKGGKAWTDHYFQNFGS